MPEFFDGFNETIKAFTSVIKSLKPIASFEWYPLKHQDGSVALI